ncbi:helix-turn-helix domain-containing protein [Streptomyces minutiscleroticus]|uniref:helix-turn-helix domain-containing protein n=1 Tax=Streptomyces minutiscleroticus TaxID=68238 RepID=UPI00332E7DA0
MVGTPPPEALGPLLRGLRHAAGMTLEELAEASGVSDRAIGDMERGRSRGPRARTVQALADALRLSPEDADRLLGAARDGRRRVYREKDGSRGLCDLPPRVADFTGREEELAWLARDGGADAGARAAIVSGGPGLGKTSLVVQAAHHRAGRFPGGRFHVDLRGLDPRPLSPHDALARLLKSLGVREDDLPSDPDERTVLLRRTVRDRNLLVILDNAADEAQVRPLLPGEGACTFWVTSRRALTGIEHARRLALAPLPAGAAASLLAGITAGRPTRTPASDPAALARIAELCGGLPLALRIAGNRLVSRPSWSAANLADRLAAEDLRLDRLAAGDLRVKSAFTLSYEQLTRPARLLFRRLSLVPGPDFSPALGAALTGLPLDRVEQMLDELVELGLLDPAVDDRARFHDLVRLYAHQRLVEEETAGAREAARTAMNAWLLATARAAGQWFEPRVTPPPAPGGLADLTDRQTAEAWLRTESANWFAALQDAAAAGQWRTVVDVAESMHWFSDRWAFWGHWHTVYRLARTAARALGDPALEATHANYLSWAYTYCLRRPGDGLAVALEAAELARTAGDTVQEAWALAYAAYAGRWLGKFDRALPWAERAAELFALAGDKEGHPQALITLARHQHALRRFQESLDVMNRVVDLVTDPRTAPAPHIADYTAMNASAGAARALLGLGRWRDAVRAADRALALDPRVGVPSLHGTAALYKARALWALDERAEALRVLEDALESFTAAEDSGSLEEGRDLKERWTAAGLSP